MRVTAIAPSNIAFIKYWGKKDEILRLPANTSISMNLSNLNTTTTVEFSKDFENDSVEINKSTTDAPRVIKFIDIIRKRANIIGKVKIVSENNFPTAGGLASSASGFAALTVAATTAAGLRLSEKELSILARIGSGSASRSIPDGFVEWHEGDSSDTSYAESLYPADYWDIADVIAIIDEGKKDVPSTEGHKSAQSSIFFPDRMKNINNKIKNIKEAIRKKDFPQFGEIIEAEALEMHAVMLTSVPPLIYWQPATIRLMREVINWRREGLSVYFTIDAGPHLHLICQKKDERNVTKRLILIEEVEKTVINSPSAGARIITATSGF